MNCGRLRVEEWENGDKICERCSYNQITEEFEFEMDEEKGIFNNADV